MLLQSSNSPADNSTKSLVKKPKNFGDTWVSQATWKVKREWNETSFSYYKDNRLLLESRTYFPPPYGVRCDS